ncbi:transposase [Aliikangiella coralliicola]|uniref:Transposase n=1 Tax=Aliikangiella coralliicola TaxID=2592383 RepID=A0A545UJ95_9GAMM|nr:transposase [Aliikangiella coralliicola]TQV89540.1 transposase [Aliikangiella coralliicola]
MAVARRNLVDKETPGFYHCTNRCVRRAFLCGFDKETGRNFDHRKAWLEKRMFVLCEIFSVEIYAYAIMDNHYHIVLYLDPLAPQQWSDEEVAERWLKVYPSRLDLPENAHLREMKKLAIMDNPEKLKEYRTRLGDLSWFMRRLNEPLAKLANQEEFCTGRFWEGRFYSQALLDEAAVLSCMAYVDLNPVRARITEKLEESHHTSIKQRLDDIQSQTNQSKLDSPLETIAGHIRERKLSITLREYTELVEWAGKSIIHPDKAAIPPHVAPVLDRLNLQQNHWLKQIESYGKQFYRVVGSINKIRKRATELKLRYLRGISAAQKLYNSIAN